MFCKIDDGLQLFVLTPSGKQRNAAAHEKEATRLSFFISQNLDIIYLLQDLLHGMRIKIFMGKY